MQAQFVDNGELFIDQCGYSVTPPWVTNQGLVGPLGVPGMESAEYDIYLVAGLVNYLELLQIIPSWPPLVAFCASSANPRCE